MSERRSNETTVRTLLPVKNLKRSLPPSVVVISVMGRREQPPARLGTLMVAI